MSTVKAAAVQLSRVLYSREGTVAKVVGKIHDLAEQTEVNIRQHSLESACFVICATAWLDADQQAQIVKDTDNSSIGPISGGCFTAIVAPAQGHNLLDE